MFQIKRPDQEVPDIQNGCRAVHDLIQPIDVQRAFRIKHPDQEDAFVPDIHNGCQAIYDLIQPSNVQRAFQIQRPDQEDASCKTSMTDVKPFIFSFSLSTFRKRSGFSALIRRMPHASMAVKPFTFSFNLSSLRSCPEGTEG